MADLRRRFGLLVAANRQRRGLTQDQLAEAADISSDMIAKIETGASGARFPVIERIAAALNVDPAELFTTDMPAGAINRGPFLKLSTRLAALSGADLVWIVGIVEGRSPQGATDHRNRVPQQAAVRSLRQTARGSPRYARVKGLRLKSQLMAAE
jgi:DNA-binding XRE family transcriptional regulator